MIPVDAPDRSSLTTLLRQQRLGHTLSREFYTSRYLFEFEVDQVLANLWQLAGHVSEIPNPGDFFVHAFGRESIIVIRDKSGEVNAFFNLCRHRGSRLCPESSGNHRKLVCPYHAWTYDLSGELLHARELAEDFDKSDHALLPCRIEIFEGIIFINLGNSEVPDFSTMTSGVEPFLGQHGLTDAIVICTQVYEFAGNWKLALDNFNECYHCLPSHPTYSRIHDYVRRGNIPNLEEDDVTRDWAVRSAAQGHKVGILHSDEAYPQPYRVNRRPIKAGYLTNSADGKPVAPLMGNFASYDGGETGFTFEPFSSVQAANDYATLFQMLPVDERHTRVTLKWLVRADARAGENCDIERLREVWHVTTSEDQLLVGNNQAGVESSRYMPGRYTDRESPSARAMAWYLREMGARLSCE